MSQFRTIEVSDPRFEPDHLRFITLKSQYLKGRGDICVFVPPAQSSPGQLPIVLLLHGVYGSAWSWALKTGVHLQALELIQRGDIPSMIIAMPSDGLWGDGSAYLPHNGYDFEKWIAEEVKDVLGEVFPGAGKDSPLFIAGLSMGGFGALRIGAKYGRQFRGISAHSSITSLEQVKLFVEEDLNNYAQKDPVDEDVLKIFQRFREQLPPLRFDCGTSDLLLEYNRDLHRQMQLLDLPHHYEEHSGGHEWSYWEEHISRSLLFFAKQLDPFS